MVPITVFTPTFNRKDTLRRTYESLLNQTNPNFEWLIVDDGSTDGTDVEVKKWIDEEKLRVRYIHKENGGLHTGYNVAISNIDSELCMCVDSDDFLPEDSIDIILDIWRRHKSPKLAGIIGLDLNVSSGEPIGGLFSLSDCILHFVEIESKLRHFGDTKIVMRTELFKPLLPMKSFGGEKNFNPSYLYMVLNPEYKYFVTNSILCCVEYQEGGMSSGVPKQYLNSPRSFAELKKAKLSHPLIPFPRKLKDAGVLVNCALISRKMDVFKGHYNKLYVIPGIPLGLFLYAYTRYKTRK